MVAILCVSAVVNRVLDETRKLLLYVIKSEALISGRRGISCLWIAQLGNGRSCIVTLAGLTLHGGSFLRARAAPEIALSRGDAETFEPLLLTITVFCW